MFVTPFTLAVLGATLALIATMAGWPFGVLVLVGSAALLIWL